MLGRLVNRFKKHSLQEDGPAANAATAATQPQPFRRGARISALHSENNSAVHDSSTESDDDELEQLDSMSNASLGAHPGDGMGSSPPNLTSRPPLISDFDTNRPDSKAWVKVLLKWLHNIAKVLFCDTVLDSNRTFSGMTLTFEHIGTACCTRVHLNADVPAKCGDGLVVVLFHDDGFPLAAGLFTSRSKAWRVWGAICVVAESTSMRELRTADNARPVVAPRYCLSVLCVRFELRGSFTRMRLSEVGEVSLISDYRRLIMWKMPGTLKECEWTLIVPVIACHDEHLRVLSVKKNLESESAGNDGECGIIPA
ncbi:unnamed protein product [Toxocara canis]|uniref:MH2 domain-containing protein n=1 Tax=Toxocara canis TaxID=6265 RepID=A0A183UMH4_TOXCA|nr:unnamed protein product [Toxocara canis]